MLESLVGINLLRQLVGAGDYYLMPFLSAVTSNCAGPQRASRAGDQDQDYEERTHEAHLQKTNIIKGKKFQ